jgi:hypothetical protein
LLLGVFRKQIRHATALKRDGLGPFDTALGVEGPNFFVSDRRLWWQTGGQAHRQDIVLRRRRGMGV